MSLTQGPQFHQTTVSKAFVSRCASPRYCSAYGDCARVKSSSGVFLQPQTRPSSGWRKSTRICSQPTTTHPHQAPVGQTKFFKARYHLPHARSSKSLGLALETSRLSRSARPWEETAGTLLESVIIILPEVRRSQISRGFKSICRQSTGDTLGRAKPLGAAAENRKVYQTVVLKTSSASWYPASLMSTQALTALDHGDAPLQVRQAGGVEGSVKLEFERRLDGGSAVVRCQPLMRRTMLQFTATSIVL